MIKIIEEIMKHVNGATFGAGVVFGVALSIAALVVVGYVLRYWKQALLLTAITATAALVALAW